MTTSEASTASAVSSFGAFARRCRCRPRPSPRRAAGLICVGGRGAGGADLDPAAGEVRRAARRPSGSGRRCGRRRTAPAGSGSSGVPLGCRRVGGTDGGSDPGDAVGQLGDDAVEGGVVPRSSRIGDRPVQRAPLTFRRTPGPASSSWAASQTVMTRLAGPCPRRRRRGGGRRRRAAAGRGPAEPDAAGPRRRRRDAPPARGACRQTSPEPGWWRSTARRRAGSGPSCGCRRTPRAPRPARHRPQTVERTGRSVR